MKNIIISEVCPYCQKSRSPHSFIHQPGGVKICTDCEHRHHEALDALSTGNFTGECSECGRSAAKLKEEKRCGPGGAMAIHYEAGRYRMMCLACDQTYVPLRRELYGETQYGRDLKLN